MPVETTAWLPLENWLVYFVMAAMVVGLAIARGAIKRCLGASGPKWSLAIALSEEADLTLADDKGVPVNVSGTVVKTMTLWISTKS